MADSNKILAIIPARGGSKRLPGKNIRQLDGRPLIAYSILAAKSTLLIDDVVVASDSLDISQAANQYHAVHNYLDPKLTIDAATLVGSLKETVLAYGDIIATPEWIVLLQPTCPLRQPSLINKWIQEVLNKPNCDGGLTVDKSGFKLGYCDLSGFYTPDYIPMTSKASGSRHWGRENGLFYMFKAENVLNGKPFGKRMIPLENPPIQSLANIDTQLDWDVTEYLFHAKGYKGMFDTLEMDLNG